MVIYQDLDELNYPVSEYLDLVIAAQSADDLAYWHDMHLFHADEDLGLAEELAWLGVA